MRERLIELLKAAKKNRGMYSPEGYLMGATFNIPLVEDKYVELLADHLIANDVTILPEGAIILTRAEIEALNKYEEARKNETN